MASRKLKEVPAERLDAQEKARLARRAKKLRAVDDEAVQDYQAKLSQMSDAELEKEIRDQAGKGEG